VLILQFDTYAYRNFTTMRHRFFATEETAPATRAICLCVGILPLFISSSRKECTLTTLACNISSGGVFGSGYGILDCLDEYCSNVQHVAASAS